MNDFTVLHLSDLHIDNTDGHLSVLLKNFWIIDVMGKCMIWKHLKYFI